MTTDQQRVAIAEACGWQLTGLHELDPLYPQCMYTVPESRKWIGDPTADLNSMHEAEKVLTEEQWQDYADELVAINSTWRKEQDCFLDLSTGDIVDVLRLTAAQRAEAFLKTLNLWKP